MGTDDPFGLAGLRAATIDAWRTSPTRFAEDAAAEDDLATVGYRDRLITELAANAADAAAARQTAGRLTVWGEGNDLHVANTGAPLSDRGVRSMLALRVSAKAGSTEEHVGRFGVGFTATSTVADRVEVRSTTGTVVFDRAATKDAMADPGANVRPIPLLRLAWSGSAGPVDGADTEIVLGLADDERVGDLLAAAHAQAVDLLLALPALSEIVVEGTVYRITREERDDASLLTVTIVRDGETAERRWHEGVGADARWLVEMDGDRPKPLAGDVLHAPTPTDVELSLPARVIAALPLTPDRRHLHPDARIDMAAAGYVELVRSLPAAARPLLVPDRTAVRNGADATLVAAVLDRLSDEAWLPAADGDDLVPRRAVVLPDLTDELSDALAPLMGDLAHAEVSERGGLPRLRSIGVASLTLAGLAERLTGVDREPRWWQRLYDALSPHVSGPMDVEELGALPIPRADGRMHIGARGMVVAEAAGVPMRWLASVAADADHPLLERLGAERMSVSDALADRGLAALVEQMDDDDDEAAVGLADEVLGVLAADPEAFVPPTLSALLIRDDQGELRPADELLLADGPLAGVLVDDAPFGHPDPALIDRFGSEVLRRVGVGWGFLTVTDDLPVAPDHDLADEEDWWEYLPETPETLSAVRDLDLVADERWPEALSVLVSDPLIAPQLLDVSGYTSWWLRHHARVHGRPLGAYRAPSDDSVAGVRDPLDHPAADQLAGALGGIRIASAADAAVLLGNLGEPARDISAGVAARVHTALVDACRNGTFEPSELDVPQRVRALSGDAVNRALVLDRPWFAQVIDPAELVVAVRGLDDRDDMAADAELLAEILDLPTVTDDVRVVVADEGIGAANTDAVPMRFALLGGRPLRGAVRLHDELWIRLDHNDSRREIRVRWWVDENGITHLDREWC